MRRRPNSHTGSLTWPRAAPASPEALSQLERPPASVYTGPGMKHRRWGRVIHISSIMALASTPQRNAYSASKAALVGMAKASALDL